MRTVPTTSDLLLRDARLVDGDALVDVLLDGGRIAAVSTAGARPRCPSRPSRSRSTSTAARWCPACGTRTRTSRSGRWCVSGSTCRRRRRPRTPPPWCAPACGRAARPAATLVGYGFRTASWPDAPHRHGARRRGAAGGLPVVLVSGDLHSALGVDGGPALPRHREHPTGLLREEEWMPISQAVRTRRRRGRRASGRRGAGRRRPRRRRRRRLRGGGQPHHLAPAGRGGVDGLRVRAGCGSSTSTRSRRRAAHGDSSAPGAW